MCIWPLFLFFALCQNVLRLPSHNKINQLSRVFKLKTSVHIFFCRVSKSFANGRNIQIEPLPHFKERAFHSFFGIFSFFILSSFGFLSKKSPLCFWFNVRWFVNKNPSIIKPRQFLIKSGQLTALENSAGIWKGNSRQQTFSHFTKFYWSVPSVNDILLGFL